MGEPAKTGRPSIYSDALVDELCFRLMEGRSLKSICSDEDMPDQRTVFRWLLEPEKQSFRQKYEQAREIQMDTGVDETLDIADDGRNDWMMRRGKDDAGWVTNGENVQRSKLRVDQRMKMAALLYPKKYGQANRVELTGGLDLRSKSTDDLLATVGATLASIGRREDAEDKG